MKNQRDQRDILCLLFIFITSWSMTCVDASATLPECLFRDTCDDSYIRVYYKQYIFGYDNGICACSALCYSFENQKFSPCVFTGKARRELKWEACLFSGVFLSPLVCWNKPSSFVRASNNINFYKNGFIGIPPFMKKKIDH